jgi:isopentenyldiphosphate isomerase
MDELFPLVDEQGKMIGSARRSDVHGNPRLLHPVVHCLVTSDRGELLLQRRSLDKDIQPGRWDTSVGGHVVFGETVEQALLREMQEEIGIDGGRVRPRKLYQYVHRNAVEAELVHTYACVHNGPFRRQEAEIDELRFFGPAGIRAALGSGLFTPNFEEEYARYLAARDADSPG